MAQNLPDTTVISDLDAATNGTIAIPGDDEYTEGSEIWNHRLQKYPAIVIRCEDSSDVTTAVSFAREHDIPLAIKGGGHSYAGNATADDGVVIDVSPIDYVDVDPDARIARVGAGATWADVDAATQEHGLATVGPTVSNIGVGGSTLGGGSGHLARSFGLSLDNVQSMEVVTADGDTITASDDEHTELFWALRGGSGNFGVVTEFEYTLHEVGPEVHLAQAMFPIDQVPDVLAFYREFNPDLPDTVTCYPFVIPIPPVDDFPEELHGQPAIMLVASYVGDDQEEGQKLVEPLLEFGEPYFSTFDPIPYTALQSMFDEGAPDGQRWYSKAGYLDEITDEVIEAYATFGADLHGPLTMAYFEPLGGAVERVDPEETAFPHRDRPYGFHILCGWMDQEQDETMIDWTDSFYEAVAEHADEGVYVNLLSGDEPERIPEAYGRNYERLQAVKREYDPENVFHATHNIETA